jgi:cytochrome b involved in lipid metabolism
MQITVKRLQSGEVSPKNVAVYKEATLDVENDHLVSSVVQKATKAMGLDGGKEWVLTTSEGTPLLSGGDMKSAKDMGVYYLAATGMSLAEVEPHRVNKDCWVVIDVSSVFDASDFGHFVYDVSAYINDHPGGKEIVLKQSGGLAGCKKGFL